MHKDWYERNRKKQIANVLARPRQPRRGERGDLKPAVNAVMVTAWGDTKTLAQWLQDPQAQIHDLTSYHLRIKRGLTPEDALSSPATHIDGDDWTSAEDAILKRRWRKLKDKDLALLLGRSVYSVRARRRVLGLMRWAISDVVKTQG